MRMAKIKKKNLLAIHVRECLKSKTPERPNEGVEQKELSFTLVGIQNGPASMEDNLAVSCKAHRSLIL